MSIDYNFLRVRVFPGRIRANFDLLQAMAGPCVPVVKSDAYGHGLVETASALMGQGPECSTGATALAVGNVAEAVKLRDAGFDCPVICLLGPVLAEDYEAVFRHRLTPLVYGREQLALLEEAGQRLSMTARVAVKFDTGMGRLGFAVSEAEDVARLLKESATVRPAMLCSHLATADDPGQREFVLEQAARFDAAARAMRRVFQDLPGSLSNSAALMAFPELRHEGRRPGIALYGANPLHGTGLEHLGAGLQPAMEVTAPLLQVHDLPRGATVSYGRIFTAPRDMRVAVVAVGYADAYSRALSSRDGQGARMVVHGQGAPLVGRVCMQMSVIDVTGIPRARAGDQAYLLGGEGDTAVRPEELAAWWGTIPYEAFCLLGLNPRTHE